MTDNLLKEFAQSYGVKVHDLTHFAGGYEWSDGTVYSYKQNGKSYLLKILHPSHQDNFAFERTAERMQYLHYLGSNGVLIVTPIPDLNGELIISRQAEGKQAIGYAWQKIEGKHFDGKAPQELISFYQDWGKTIGSIHRLAKLYPDWQHSRSLDHAGNPLICRKAEFDVFYNWLKDDDVRDVWSALYDKMNLLPISRDNFGFIHNDLHSGNLLINETGVYALDFDVANFHWFIMDIAIACYSEINRLRHTGLTDIFEDYVHTVIDNIMLGYTKENTLTDVQPELLEMFFAYRRIIMFAVFYNEVKAKNPDYLKLMKQRIINNESILKQTAF